MVQPFNYQLQSADPFAGVLQGLKLGATIEEMQAARMQAEMKQQQALAAQQRQQQIAQEYERFQALPNRTLEDVQRLSQFIPPEQTKVLLDIYKTKGTEQQDALKRTTGGILAALKNDKNRGVELIKQRAQLERNAGNVRDADAYDTYAKIAEINPDAVFTEVLTSNAEVFGKDWVNSVLTATGAKGGAQVLSTPEAKRAAGLLDDQGKVLSGTYVSEPGKAPTLLQVKEVPTDAVIVSSDDDKRRRGLVEKGVPIPGVFAVEPGKAPKRIDKEGGPLVNVNVPGQERLPTKLEEEIDKKFAPLAVEWMGGEKSRSASRINQLKAVTNVLESGKRITGPVVGLTPDVVLSFVNPGSREARATAERVIQDGMRATLGAQFTRVEGENFLARAYDPKALQADNVRRLRAIVTQMEESAKDRESMMKYMQGPGKGSLQGYTGRVPTIDDFYAAIEVQTPAAPAAAPAVDTSRAQAVDAALQKYMTKPGGR
jgi:hypothetical protein